MPEYAAAGIFIGWLFLLGVAFLVVGGSEYLKFQKSGDEER